MSFNWKASGLFAAGVAFGTAGIKILSSKDAKHAYTQCTAAALRAKDCVMKTVNTVQENAEDILAEAKSINEGAPHWARCPCVHGNGGWKWRGHLSGKL